MKTVGCEHRPSEFQLRALFLNLLINIFNWYFILWFLSSVFLKNSGKVKPDNLLLFLQYYSKYIFQSLESMKLSELQNLLLVQALVFWLTFDYPELIPSVNFFAVMLNPRVYSNFTFFDCFPLSCFHSGSEEIEKLHSTLYIHGGQWKTFCIFEKVTNATFHNSRHCRDVMSETQKITAQKNVCIFNVSYHV